MELWLQRPKRERTAEGVLGFYGWQSDYRANLVAIGPAPSGRLSKIGYCACSNGGTECVCVALLWQFS